MTLTYIVNLSEIRCQGLEVCIDTNTFILKLAYVRRMSTSLVRLCCNTKCFYVKNNVGDWILFSKKRLIFKMCDTQFCRKKSQILGGKYKPEKHIKKQLLRHAIFCVLNLLTWFRSQQVWRHEDHNKRVIQHKKKISPLNVSFNLIPRFCSRNKWYIKSSKSFKNMYMWQPVTVTKC